MKIFCHFTFYLIIDSSLLFVVLERMKPIAVASFHEHVQQMHVDSDKGFETEYKVGAAIGQGLIVLT